MPRQLSEQEYQEIRQSVLDHAPAGMDEASFQRFSRMREIRKSLSLKNAIPAYAIFTDEELSELAKIEALTLAVMKSVKGVGEKKVEKYGMHFISNPE